MQLLQRSELDQCASNNIHNILRKTVLMHYINNDPLKKKDYTVYVGLYLFTQA